VYTVAALFGTHPNGKQVEHNLGSSLAQLRESKQFSNTGLESRLVRLCRSATSQELCRNLPQIVALIVSGDVPISWSALARDIDGWDFRSDQISRRWLRAFFSDGPLDTTNDSSVTSPDMITKEL
jgi:CRISPR type I-E-associated protein CasB/Cse2